jgi:pimeloyl-ACP methyl ester carboxylesterase
LEKIFCTNPTITEHYFYKIGTGKTCVLLIHGFAESLEIFETILSEISTHFTIILPNLPGTNNTKPLSNSSIKDLAEFCEAIMQQLNIEKYFVAGHSMGGYIACEILKNCSKNILGLTLINSHCYADEPEKKETRLKGIETIKEGKRAVFIRTLIYKIYHHIFAKNNSEVLEKHILQAETISDEGIIAYYTAMLNRNDHQQTLAKAECPIQFIFGTDDVTVDKKLLLQQSSLPKISFIYKLQDTGHISMNEAPDKLAEYLQYFWQFGV